MPQSDAEASTIPNTPEASTIPNTPEASTIPDTPEDLSKFNTVNDKDAFALLRPINAPAQDAFDESMNAIVENVSGNSNHYVKFMYAQRGPARCASVFTEAEGTDIEEPDGQSASLRWNGAFRFSLQKLPQNRNSGWYIGTSLGHSDSIIPGVDVLLAPPTIIWQQRGIAGRHARLYLHEDSYRMVLEARHTVTVGNIDKVIRDSQSQVLCDKDLVVIGDCTYSFEYTDHFQSVEFEAQFLQYIQQIRGSQWTINKLLSPASVGAPLPVGTYFRSPSAFAQGTFGQVAVGWAHDGAAVAIKVVKKPSKFNIESHQRVMQIIGAHDNIVQLLDCVANFQTQIPIAYCIYSPLAVMTVEGVIDSCETSSATQLTLLKDYLAGLLHLHDKGIMHRDIKPANMAVKSLQVPIGVILDLDSAITSPTSIDHNQGTVPYLAPEIIALKEWDSSKPMPPAYENSVDIWALGLSMFTLLTKKHWSWRPFSTEDEVNAGRYSDKRYRQYRKRVDQLMTDATPSGPGNDFVRAKVLESIGIMTENQPKQRLSASVLLKIVQSTAAKGDPDISINLKQTDKHTMADEDNRSQLKRQHFG
ncbi:hypothetical protein MMC11_005447 [Xylographa trunciseda]|nr:hypothetical protein [Xylographa trunciseda]